MDAPRKLRLHLASAQLAELMFHVLAAEQIDLATEEDALQAIQDAMTDGHPASVAQASFVAMVAHLELAGVALADRDLPRDLQTALADPEEGRGWSAGWEDEKSRWLEFNTFGEDIPIDKAK